MVKKVSGVFKRGASAAVRFGTVSLPVALVMVAFAANSAFAATTGIDALDGSGAKIVAFVTGLVWVGAVVLIGTAIWELIARQQLRSAITEFVVGVVVAIIAFNAPTILAAFGMAGAHI